MAKDNPKKQAAAANGVKKRPAFTFASIKSEMIEVIVGSSKQKYCIHKDILCASSPVFQRRCNREAKGTKALHIELLDSNPTHFDVYVEWLYFDQLFTVETENNYKGMNWDIFLSVYLLGYKLQDQKFKDACVDIAFNNPTDRELLKLTSQTKAMYKELPPSDQYRRLFVEFWAYSANENWFAPANAKHLRDAPMEFFRDVAKASIRITDGCAGSFGVRYFDQFKPKRSDFCDESKDTTNENKV
ncbi:speckle-type poz [Diplodia corticola]|uniref:Speckle-type poz n=1 Tax=Diplodia corticola TaxID=236234 RepID=A0A1J9R8T0_9PEZI|nr:speckle-type poz [Diplodia corticola]OJD37966.1 speckle-type poz [Diplodia corticola]